MTALAVGAEVPTWAATVEPGPMKVFSLLTRDPNPIHWDRAAVETAGLGSRLVNQGGLNVAYVVNAVRSWLGPDCLVCSLQVRFLANAYEGEDVVAGGSVVDVSIEDGRRTAVLDVWLRRADGSGLLKGSMTVASPSGTA